MFRLLLRVLLIVSLAGNGLAAPSAMASMRSDAHASHAAIAKQGAVEAHHGHRQHRHEASHSRHDAGAAHHHDETADADGGSCCDGPGCQCGCVLPPMLARAAATARPAIWSAAPRAEPPLRERPATARLPFRPPAA